MRIVINMCRSIFFVSFFVVFPSDGWSKAKKIALLVGINEYEDSDGQKITDLKGPLNDVEIFRDALEMYGFSDEAISIISQENATKRRILHQLDSQIEKLVEGDLFVFYFAGHGSQIWDQSGGDEGDFKDESILPRDARLQRRAEVEDPGDIRDDELYQRIAELNEKKVHSVFVIDSCHSGTITKAPDSALARFAPIGGRRYSGGIANHWLASDPTHSMRGESGIKGPVESLSEAYHVTITASTATERAFERPRGAAGTVYGDFTWALVRALRSPPTDVGWPTYRSLVNRVRELLLHEGLVEQRPQIEGHIANHVFVDSTPRNILFPASRKSPREVMLHAGALHGMSVNSRLKIFSDEETAERKSPEFQATIRLTDVQPTASTAIVEEIRDQDFLRGVAIEIEHSYESSPLNIAFLQDLKHEVRLSISSIVKDIGGIVVDAGKGLPDIVFSQGSNDDHVKILLKDGVALGSEISVERLDRVIRERVRKFHRFRNLIGLTRGRDGGMDISGTLETFDADSKSWHDAESREGIYRLGKSDLVRVRVRKAGSGAGFVHVLLTSNDFSIRPIISGESAVDLGVASSNEICEGKPGCRSSISSGIIDFGASEISHLKIIVTDFPMSVASVLQGRIKAPTGSMEKLFQDAFLGRQIKSSLMLGGVQDWDTQLLSVELE